MKSVFYFFMIVCFEYVKFPSFFLQEEEPDISNLDVDYDYFESFIWPILAERYRGMEELKVCRSVLCEDHRDISKKLLSLCDLYYGTHCRKCIP